MADIAVLPTSKTQGEQFEQTHVRKIYDEIATSVNDIEHKAWPKVKRFVKKFETGSLIADIGCGNGRYLDINKNVYKIGFDVCCALVDNSRLKGYEVSYADNLHIPLRDNMFDGVVSIGVIHHFCSMERRIQAIKELSRIIKPGGKVMIYVWAYEQRYRKFDSQDVLIPWHDGSWNNKRHGSTSSRHSSIGGLSSTSSVSEDESLDFSKEDADAFSHNSSGLQRKNSISLDDLTTLTDLGNFKASYYSLDFNGSPSRSSKLGSSVESKGSENAIVNECRKLEESMRALSANNLDELRTKSSSQRKVLTKTGAAHLSLESLESGKNEQSNDNYLHNDENNISFLEEEILEAEILSFPHGVKYLEIDKPRSRSRQGRRKSSRERNNHTPCAKINPFLKQDSFDAYTFNNVAVSSDDSDSLEDIMEVDSENTQDEVFIKFQPEGHDQTNGKKITRGDSFFGSLKSKLLKLFEENVDKKATTENKKLSTSLSKINQTDFTELTHEQLSLADKLNFRVREFPQSSCPEIHGRQFFNNGYKKRSSDADFFQQWHRNADMVHQNYHNSTDSQSTDSFLKHCQNTDNKYLNNATHPDPSKLYKLGQEKMNDCMLQNQKFETQISVEEVIYDSFIKLDVNDGALETKSPNGALHSNAKATDASFSFNYENIDGSDQGCETHQNINNKSKEFYNDIQNGCHRQFSKEKDNKDSVAEQKRDILSENLKNIQNNSLDLDKLNREKTVDLSTTDVMNDSGISEKDDGMKGKLCRYYHVFREGELEALISSHVPKLKVIQGFYDHANWCVVAEKC